MGGDLKTSLAIAAWAPNLPGTSRVLDAEHLLKYRHPDEIRALWVAVGVVGISGAAALAVDPAVLGIVLGTWIFLVVAVMIMAARHIATGGEITPTQFAHLYPMVQELRERFALPHTRVFVVQSPVINAFAFGFREPYAIVLHSALIDAMDELELKSILGHEMGHIKFGHTRLGVIFGGLEVDSGVPLPFPLNFVADARRFVFLWWNRCQELSCDRAGVVASGRPSKMISSLVKMGIGPTMYPHVNIDDLAHQAADLRQGWWRMWAFIGQATATHPFLVNRIQAVVDFVGGPEPGHNLKVRDPETFGGASRSDRAEVDTSPDSEFLGSAIPTASLAVRSGPEVGRTYPLDGRPVTVGRSLDNDIPLDDAALSRRHFQINWVEDAYHLVDLGSRNGTRVNGAREPTARLRSGDRIRVGHVELEFTQN
jgi:Zn-dependent protease with chaperone function